MKKFFTMVAVAIITATSAQAQSDELKNEIGVFYGIGSISNILSIFTSSFAAAVGDKSSFFGPIGVEYFYHTSPVVALGAMATYSNCKAENEKTGKKDLKETFISVMPSAKFNWLRKDHFGLYSGLSAGVIFVTLSCENDVKKADPDAKDETKVSIAFQLTALGAEFGGSAFRGFVEAGFGEKGTLCAGLRYKF